MILRGPEMIQRRPVRAAPGHLMRFPIKTLSGVAMEGASRRVIADESCKLNR